MPPKLIFDKRPGGCMFTRDSNRSARFCLNKMRLWGYFVDESKIGFTEGTNNSCEKDYNSYSTKPKKLHYLSSLRVLWVGRFLNWKRVGDIVRAVAIANRLKHVDAKTIELDLYGEGPDKLNVMKLAKDLENVRFYDAIPINEVRTKMREHDVYVLSSNGYEGWGAVVNEALAESMTVIGSRESGSCATILPESNLFVAGDFRELANKLICVLKGEIPKLGLGCWTVKYGAKTLVRFFREISQ